MQTLTLEFGPKAQESLGRENLTFSTYPLGEIIPGLYDTMTFFLYGSENVFTVVFRRWYIDEHGEMRLTIGLELND